MRKTIFRGEKTTPGTTVDRTSGALGPGRSQKGARHFVYMLECSDGTIYTGYTTNPARRLAEHNDGTAARYTRSRRPVRLVFLQELPSRGEALSREIRLKRFDKDRKLLLCRGYLERDRQSSR